MAAPPKLARPKAVLSDVLARLIARGQEVHDKIDAENARQLANVMENWDQAVKTMLAEAFTSPDPAQQYPSYFNRNYYLNGSTTAVNATRIKRDLQTRLQVLASINDMLDIYDEPSEADLAPERPAERPGDNLSSSIFVIHGRSDIRHKIVRFLGDVVAEAEPIILDERPEGSRVIIETLESYASQVSFAIAVLTGDDFGGLAGSQETRKRARQNVVFELGFFLAALGRSRVAVLYEDDVELPSDVHGVIYTSLDAQGAWKLSLGRQLRSAGFSVDLNLAG
jgi:predicted nucleotide-binding protein